MSTKLKSYFPMLWERTELLKEIQNNTSLSYIFNTWTAEQQEIFLNFCTGVSGIKFLYDGFFKELMNPEYHPERLNDFLSELLKMKVKIHAVLPNDSTRITDESSLLIMDIVVELEDSSLANIEVQKIGYNFPGQRSACYSADLLLRQYKRVRSLKKKKFSYKDIKTVYTIVLFEESTSEFHDFPNTYIHYFEQCSDTGLQLELLQKFLFIPLDIFRENQHNKIISSKLDAWLLFFSSDHPEDIFRLCEQYPEFRAMYEQAYDMCRNVENVMGIFSKELQILDRNTVQLMIDEMQDTINAHRNTIDSQVKTINSQEETINSQVETINSQKEQLNAQTAEIAELKRQLELAKNS